MMKVKQTIVFIMAAILIMCRCNPVIPGGEQLPGAQAGLSPDDDQSPPSVRVLNKADKTYIDWIIPEYPDVILFHEGSAETLRFTEEVYHYLKLKNAGISKRPITQKYADKPRDGRLYIADVGENWYEVYIFDEWK